jgi:tetratricopeptide (TPR) repeat protein
VPSAGPGTPETEVRARALQGAGVLAFYQADYASSRALLEESLTLFRGLGDKRGTAWSLIYLGMVTNEGGDPASAIPLQEEALSLAREAGDQLGVSWALARIGVSAMFQGQFGRAIGALDEKLRLARSLGDRRGMAFAMENLGFCQIFRREPELVVGERLELEAIAIWREIGERRNLAHSLGILGVAYILMGKLSEAGSLCRERTQIQVEIGDTWGILQVMVAFAVLAAEQGQFERAIRLDGAATTLAEATGVPVVPMLAGWASPYLDRARRALGPTVAQAARQKGQAMTLEEAVEYALSGEEGDT